MIFNHHLLLLCNIGDNVDFEFGGVVYIRHLIDLFGKRKKKASQKCKRKNEFGVELKKKKRKEEEKKKKKKKERKKKNPSCSLFFVFMHSCE